MQKWLNRSCLEGQTHVSQTNHILDGDPDIPAGRGTEGALFRGMYQPIVTDQDAVWGADTCEPNEPYLSRGSRYSYRKGHF